MSARLPGARATVRSTPLERSRPTGDVGEDLRVSRLEFAAKREVGQGDGGARGAVGEAEGAAVHTGRGALHLLQGLALDRDGAELGDHREGLEEGATLGGGHQQDGPVSFPAEEEPRLDRLALEGGAEKLLEPGAPALQDLGIRYPGGHPRREEARPWRPADRATAGRDELDEAGVGQRLVGEGEAAQLAGDAVHGLGGDRQAGASGHSLGEDLFGSVSRDVGFPAALVRERPR